MSDSEDDYGSKQKYVIDDQIDLFEFRQAMKNGRKKRKIKKKLYKFSMVNKYQDTKYKHNTFKVRQKSSGYIRYHDEPVIFECDREFQITESKPIQTSSISINSSPKAEMKSKKHQSKNQKHNESKKNNYSQMNSLKKLTGEQLINFSSFRQHFYQSTHHLIKSSFDNLSNTKINNIRLASINETIQNCFMKNLKTYGYFPQLVYHGTQMNSIKSILHYGLLIPCQQNPIIPEAPIITSLIGQAFGKGIYCSTAPSVALTYARQTNTILVCAALPERHTHGVIDSHHGNIFVLKEESKIIPLFLLDIKYLKNSYQNFPWFDYEK